MKKIKNLTINILDVIKSFFSPFASLVFLNYHLTSQYVAPCYSFLTANIYIKTLQRFPTSLQVKANQRLPLSLPITTLISFQIDWIPSNLNSRNTLTKGLCTDGCLSPKCFFLHFLRDNSFLSSKNLCSNALFSMMPILTSLFKIAAFSITSPCIPNPYFFCRGRHFYFFADISLGSRRVTFIL